MNSADIRGQRWVVKIGSALITADNTGLNLELIQHWCAQFARLMDDGVELVLVSSGSIAEGMHRLGLRTRPRTIHELQAAAAVGQMGLVQTYESELKAHKIPTAQILLTHEDLSNRKRYLNARSTLSTLLSLSVLPVVNENDTVTTDEIKFGDNDNLAALVANLIAADRLVILTDQEGLFDRDPRSSKDAKLVELGTAGDPRLLAMAGPSGSSVGSGGMTTKLLAAERASRAGTETTIASGRTTDVLLRLKNGEMLGTHLQSNQPKLDARKQWLANQLQVRGELTVDSGASNKIAAGTSSLLAIGVIAVQGQFNRGELVSCVDANGREVARGLVNYNAQEITKLLGCHSKDIEQRLGYIDEPELINRDNMVSV
ncbi:glutamate 5-kinase [Chromatiales bacterium (ex Bugula neritina AB1)]|nr:glutamate 5-kinase [Chromatiales bacterium (ex Bugula neritina AB1)]